MPFTIASTAFTDGSMIPEKYTCDGENISPALSWQDAPANAKSFALICDDPDSIAGVWVHWIMCNIPKSSAGLAENIPALPVLQNGACQGMTTFGKIGYGGPCPGAGTHRYFFRLYALDTALGLHAGFSKETLLKAMEGHILVQAMFMGRYHRGKKDAI